MLLLVALWRGEADHDAGHQRISRVGTSAMMSISQGRRPGAERAAKHLLDVKSYNVKT